MRWLISSWLLLVGTYGLTAVHASAQTTQWHLAQPASPSFARMLSASMPEPVANANTTVAAAIDLCAPCDDGEQCSSGLCPIDNASDTGICSQKCTTSGTIGCPSGFTCYNPNDSTLQTCIPNDATVCPTKYIGALLNDVCQFPASTADGNVAFNRPCASGLICVVLPTEIGYCLNECSSIDPSFLCDPNQKCCFAIDANNTCLASTSTQTVGGCVQIQSVGDPCVDADESVCVTGAVCANTGYDDTSKCYGDCSDDPSSCPNDGACAFIANQNICCDANQYNSEDQTTCFPIVGACKLKVGVACTSDVDCQSSQCKTYGGAKACSSPCASDADCPSDTADQNGDGIADGGSHCITIGSGKLNYCWPKTTPATQPNCFFITSQEAAAGQSSGCTCQGAQAGPVWWLALVAIGLRQGRKRRAH